MRVGALRAQRVLPRGPRELPLPLLARCVCEGTCACSGWRGTAWGGAQSVCACAHAPLVDQAGGVHAIATSVSLFPDLQNRANDAPAPRGVARSVKG